jgi:NDP-sugar pyrophosphorylase family protein
VAPRTAANPFEHAGVDPAKCLVSVRGKPLLYHLFERYSGARFFVIGDYAFDQLEK